MQCPQCRTENREGRRFCAKCGAPLGMICPECGFSNDPDEDFCGGCGRALSATAASPTDSALKPETLEPERRQLTVMFCDLVGSTGLAERLDPEELRDLLAQYQQTCAETINRFEGYIARYVGDGLLVYFGYPQAHEDDPQRAVRAGLDIVEAIRELDKKTTDKTPDLAVRIGITTGLVVAGDIGSGGQVEQKAIVGETPNLAARLQGLAEPNTVMIGPGTQRLVDELFECENLGVQQLKGVSKPIPVYRVRAPTDAPSRFEATATRGLTPLIGREAEIRLLLTRWEQAKDGEGQVVLLCGEAGIGKSRVVRGFRERLEGEPHNRVLYYCSPYHQNSAFHPAIEQLERALRFEKEDNTRQKLDKLEGVLGDLGLPGADLVPLVASLLSLPTDGRYRALTLAPEQLKKATLESLASMIDAMASRHPVLMVVEDVHWVDPSTLELINLLIEELHTSRFLLISTYRPQFTPPWGSDTRATLLTLNRLSRKESTTLVSRVTGEKTIPTEVLDQIVAKTDGVPLFVEELTKNVLESGLLEDAGESYVLAGPLPPLAIPASLQDSLMARLDRLASVKEIAQLAATLGRTFSHELLAAVSPLAEQELECALVELLSAELIYRRGLPPQVTYEFKHALVQDAAYQSLLKSTRQQYHQRVAQTLEQRFPEIVEAEPELVAHHYTAAQLPTQAISYWQKAGERAKERSANQEAAIHFSKGLELLATQPDAPERAARELDINIALGPALSALKGPAASEVGQAYGRARELCRNIGKPTQRFAATWGMWIHHHFNAQLRTALELAEEILALAEQQGDPALRLEARHAAWTTRFYVPEWALCRTNAEQGIALYDMNEHHALGLVYGGHDPGVCAHNNLGVSLWYLGYPDQALAQAQEAIQLAELLSHPMSLALAFSYSCWTRHCRGETDHTRQRAKDTIKQCTEHSVAPHHVALVTVLGGWALTAQGHVQEGIAEMEQGLGGRGRTRGPLLRRPQNLVLLASAYETTGKTQEGLGAIAEALEIIAKTQERWCESEIYRIKGQILLSGSAKNQSAAEDSFKQAIEVARRHQTKSLELRAATSLARLWGDQGKRTEAHDVLGAIYGWFTEGFETADLKEAKSLLDELS